MALVANAPSGRLGGALAQETQQRNASQNGEPEWDVRNSPPGRCGAKGELTHSGPITTQHDGQVIENLKVDGRIEVQHKGVTIRNCEITGDQYYAVVLMPDKYPSASFSVEYCTVRSSVNAVAGVGRVYRCDLSRCDNGVNVWGMTAIEECFIHDLGFSVGGHNDGVENNGSPMVVRHCRIIASREKDTSAIMTNNEFGRLHDILIEGNYLEGGQYTLYCDATKSAKNMPVESFLVRNNLIKPGRYGPAALYTLRCSDQTASNETLSGETSRAAVEPAAWHPGWYRAPCSRGPSPPRTTRTLLARPRSTGFQR